MQMPKDLNEYLRARSSELADRILRAFPPLHGVDDPASPLIGRLLRKPFPAQTLAMMGVVKRWNEARGAAVIAECGTGKTLISLGSIHIHSDRKPFTALAMVPPQLVGKWAREALLTLPHLRVFFVDGLRGPTSSTAHVGVNEVKLRHGRIVREGLRTTLTELRQRKTSRTARARWESICEMPSLFIVGRDRGKLSYFWRHAYGLARCGRYQGSVVNADSGCPVYLNGDGERLLSADFEKAKLSEMLGGPNCEQPAKSRKALHSALWQADGSKVRRFAPVDFIGRYMPDFFDYAIADEVHELKGDTAQGNALGTLAGCAQRTVVLTGTLLGGYADELFNILFRLQPDRMVREGFEFGETGLRAFTETYGLLEKVTVIEPSDNACSDGRVTKRIRRRPGASPLLFGHFLMSLGAFISLEDISDALPPYCEEVISIEMDPPLLAAYKKLEEDIKKALQEHRRNPTVMSVGLNALLLYPDRPFGLGDLYGYERDPESGKRERFLIAETQDLNESHVYAKERRLVEEVKSELRHGRRCQIYAVYTKKRDVTSRLERILANEGIRVAVLTTEVAPEAREAWYERQVRAGVQTVICHPKLVQTGLDLIEFPTILFYETGYSIYVLRQASRRSWRIGQRLPVKVKFLHYVETMQETCLRLMGKKLLVSLAMEGKFSSEGLQSINDEDDILTAMARELVTEKGIGEKADEVWSALQKRQEAILGTRIVREIDVEANVFAPEMKLGDMDSLPVDEPLSPPLATELPARRNARRSSAPSEQLALF
jgi:hypothetical protein